MWLRGPRHARFNVEFKRIPHVWRSGSRHNTFLTFSKSIDHNEIVYSSRVIPCHARFYKYILDVQECKYSRHIRQHRYLASSRCQWKLKYVSDYQLHIKWKAREVGLCLKIRSVMTYSWLVSVIGFVIRSVIRSQDSMDIYKYFDQRDSSFV